VPALDDRIANLSSGAGVIVVLAVALLLGLRHATDPDHLTAVSTLAVSDEERGPARAALLGAAWGLGHALTLSACGLPVLLLHASIPAAIQRAAELAVGALIVALAVRLLHRWRCGYFHVHTHEHPHAGPRGRSPAMALAIGLVHGVGGSAGVAVLLLSAVPGRVTAAAALGIFASATALSMTLISAAFAGLLSHAPRAGRRRERVTPVLGAVSLAFGVVYAICAASSFTS
jgi:hypothetical protein